MNQCYRGDRQAGVVLLVVLLVLLVMGFVASAVSRSNLLQLHMAGNDAARVAAMQQALAAIDAVYARPANFRADVSVAHRACLAGDSSAGCDSHVLTMEAGLVPDSGQQEVAVQRVSPQEGRMPVLSESDASSTVHYRVARFEVQVAYDGIAGGDGRVSLAQGVLVRQQHFARSGEVLP